MSVAYRTQSGVGVFSTHTLHWEVLLHSWTYTGKNFGVAYNVPNMRRLVVCRQNALLRHS